MKALWIQNGEAIQRDYYAPKNVTKLAAWHNQAMKAFRQPIADWKVVHPSMSIKEVSFELWHADGEQKATIRILRQVP
jgi:hypothetical protein